MPNDLSHADQFSRDLKELAHAKKFDMSTFNEVCLRHNAITCGVLAWRFPDGSVARWPRGQDAPSIFEPGWTLT